MGRCFLLLVVGSLLYADAIRIEVRENEVWLVRNGQSKPLTHDGKAKMQALLSANNDRIAYIEECPEAEGCIPSVVILDLEGRRTQTFQPKQEAQGSDAPCASILEISWVGEDAVGVECHLNPSLSEYVEVDLATGKTVRDLLGYGFAPSPDGKVVAHVGPIIHFAPQFSQSNYLLIDNTIVYPLPKGKRPVAHKAGEDNLEVVQVQGPKHIGIHSFVPQFAWSPSSKKVAFIDCVFDWIETGAADSGGSPIGNATASRCSIAVVSLSGSFVLIPLRDLPPDAIGRSRVWWIDIERVRLEFSPTTTKTFIIP
jgi:hypothetical protein